MSKYDELKRMAEHTNDLCGNHDGVLMHVTTAAIMALIAENERLEREAKNDLIAYKAVIERQNELRAENAGLKTGYQAYERVKAELKAEVEELRKALMDAEYRIDQGKVWTENGWVYAGLSQQGQMKALEILREATKLKLNNHSYIHQYRGPKITKPTPPNKPSEPIVRRVVNEKVINANEVKP